MSSKPKLPKAFERLADYFSKELSPLLDARTIQILSLRQTHDFTILRTEESRELNTVVIPESIQSPKPSVKVAFLASKQKAVETREFSRLLRTVKDYDCYLKDKLCMKCPRCALFGAVSVTGGQEYNIKHRIEYSTAFSIERYEDLLETLTFNAIDETSQKTEQALNITHNVVPLANFPSVVSLTSVTWREFVLYLKTLLAAKSYGAETRTKGDMRNTILGIAGGYEEMITSLEFNLELAGQWESNLEETTQSILEKYSKMCASRANVTVLTPTELSSLISQVQDLPLDAPFVDSMQQDVDIFLAKVASDKKKKK